MEAFFSSGALRRRNALLDSLEELSQSTDRVERQAYALMLALQDGNLKKGWKFYASNLVRLVKAHPEKAGLAGKINHLIDHFFLVFSRPRGRSPALLACAQETLVVLEPLFIPQRRIDFSVLIRHNLSYLEIEIREGAALAILEFVNSHQSQEERPAVFRMLLKSLMEQTLSPLNPLLIAKLLKEMSTDQLLNLINEVQAYLPLTQSAVNETNRSSSTRVRAVHLLVQIAKLECQTNYRRVDIQLFFRPLIWAIQDLSWDVKEAAIEGIANSLHKTIPEYYKSTLSSLMVELIYGGEEECVIQAAIGLLGRLTEKITRTYLKESIAKALLKRIEKQHSMDESKKVVRKFLDLPPYLRNNLHLLVHCAILENRDKALFVLIREASLDNEQEGLLAPYLKQAFARLAKTYSVGAQRNIVDLILERVKNDDLLERIKDACILGISFMEPMAATSDRNKVVQFLLDFLLKAPSSVLKISAITSACNLSHWIPAHSTLATLLINNLRQLQADTRQPRLRYFAHRALGQFRESIPAMSMTSVQKALFDDIRKLKDSTLDWQAAKALIEALNHFILDTPADKKGDMVDFLIKMTHHGQTSIAGLAMEALINYLSYGQEPEEKQIAQALVDKLGSPIHEIATKGLRDISLNLYTCSIEEGLSLLEKVTEAMLKKLAQYPEQAEQISDSFVVFYNHLLREYREHLIYQVLEKHLNPPGEIPNAAAVGIYNELSARSELPSPPIGESEEEVGQRAAFRGPS